MKSKKHLAFPSFLVAALLAFASFPAPVYGLLGVSVGEVANVSGMAAEVAAELEERYHLDLETIRDYGEGFNVSTSKGNVPEVSISFSPSDPREGERLTAKAFPIFFSNPTDQLYYTWYLKRDGCDLGSASGKPEYCNADGRGNITVNDWKVAAMRILVTDNADREGFSYDSNSDSDGYEAKYGGEMEVNVGDNHKWCYVQDAETGRMFEFENGCFHLFPEPRGSGEDTGDGSFGLDEEEFWGSNPRDPDTADNGNKDEANAVGVGLDSFTWNYQVGDKVGVIVEGMSMMPTQHDDSSFMIMWALSKNLRPRLEGSLHNYMKNLCPGGSSGLTKPSSYDDDEACSIKGIDSYTESVKGYDVCFLTADLEASDFNDCLEANLVDPLEWGAASSKRLELSVSASPDNPVNDRSEGVSGDVVVANTSIDNASRSKDEILYRWTIGLSDNPVEDFRDVTAVLEEAELISATKGNGLSQVRVTLNMGRDILSGLDGIDSIYMRIRAEADENFSPGVVREGRGDVIVRISNTDKRIAAYSTEAFMTTDSVKVSLDAPICDTYYPNPSTTGEAMENLNRISCRVIPEEIIGVYVNPEGLEEFAWRINGVPLYCSEAISGDSSCLNGNAAFFAVAGDPEETYTVELDAVNLETGQAVSLSRQFQIVQPEIIIETADSESVWPRFVGTFVELDGQLTEEFSDEVFEMYVDGTISLRARTIPGHVASLFSSYEWKIDGQSVTESEPFRIDYEPADLKNVESVYFASFSGVVSQSIEKRRALEKLFGISAIASSDFGISRNVQVQTVYPEEFAVSDNVDNRFFAAVSRYVPSFVLFAFRMFATAALILFTVGFVFSLMPDTPTVKTERRRYDM